MEIIKNFVVTLVTTLIFMTAIELIAPNNSMKKYLKFVLGLILIAVILNPIIKFFTNGKTVLTEGIDKYSKEIASDNKEDKRSEENKKIREESFKNNFNKNCESLLNKEFDQYSFTSDVNCDVDFTNMSFKVTNLKIEAQEKGVKKVEKVDLEKNTNGKKRR